MLKESVMMTLGTALLLALAPVWATLFLVGLALLLRVQTLGPTGVLVGTLVGTVLATPLGTVGFQAGEALGFPFLGLWTALAFAVLAAQATATLTQVALVVLRK